MRALRQRGAVIVVYTHSEERWAARVLRAVEQVIGFPFIAALFSRTDCRDKHPHFSARKSLRHVISNGFEWAKLEVRGCCAATVVRV